MMNDNIQNDVEDGEMREDQGEEKSSSEPKQAERGIPPVNPLNLQTNGVNPTVIPQDKTIENSIS